jgi:hypothetical protein
MHYESFKMPDAEIFWNLSQSIVECDVIVKRQFQPLWGCL